MSVFTREQWQRLPSPFKRKWWRATDYGQHPAHDEGALLKEALELLQGGRVEGKEGTAQQDEADDLSPQ